MDSSAEDLAEFVARQREARDQRRAEMEALRAQMKGLETKQQQASTRAPAPSAQPTSIQPAAIQPKQLQPPPRPAPAASTPSSITPATVPRKHTVERVVEDAPLAVQRAASRSATALAQRPTPPDQQPQPRVAQPAAAPATEQTIRPRAATAMHARRDSSQGRARTQAVERRDDWDSNHQSRVSAAQSSIATTAAPSVAPTEIPSRLPRPRPASSAAVLSATSTAPRRASLSTRRPAMNATATAAAPSGRATASGHYADSSNKPVPVRHPRSASTNSHARPKSQAAAPSTRKDAQSTEADGEEMSEQQQKAYRLRMQFLGTRVYTEPKPFVPRKLSGSSAASNGAPPANTQAPFSPAPLDPSTRFLAPTASSLLSAAAAPPTVEELLAQEAEVARAIETKARAQRERAERAKQDLVKYKRQQAEIAAAEAAEAARAEEAARQLELRRKEADRIRREADRRKVESFQEAKLAREHAKAMVEVRRIEAETLERKRAVAAFVESKTQAQAERDAYDRERLQELEERIQQLTPAVETAAASPIQAPPPAKPRSQWSRLPFPVPMPAPRPAAATTASPVSLRSPPPSGPTSHAAAAQAAFPSSPLMSDSVSFFSSTTDVTQAFIAAQRAKELASTKSPPGGGGSYAARHGSTLTSAAPRHKPAGARSKRTPSNSSPGAGEFQVQHAAASDD